MANGERYGAIFDAGTTLGLGPSELLGRFAATRDEAAFAALVARHAPMVLATCRRILPHGLDADDAFQATFLVLARHAGSIRDPDRLAPWLHATARRAALRAKTLAARRRRVEGDEPGDVVVPTPPCDDLGELRAVLDEELARLPEKYRAPLVLCYLEGLTHDQAAGQLAWPVGTVRSRLAGGRDRLRSRLARRGLDPAPGVLPPLAPLAAVAPSLQAVTVRLALAAPLQTAATSAVLLAQGVLTSMTIAKIQAAAAVTLAVAATLAAGTAGVVLARQQPADSPKAGPANPPAAPAPAATNPDQAALDDLARGLDLMEGNILDRQGRQLIDRVTAERLRIDIAALKRRSRADLKPQEVASEAQKRFEKSIAGLLKPQPSSADDPQYAADIANLRTRAEAMLQQELRLDQPRPAAPGKQAATAPGPMEVDALKARIKVLEAELAKRDAAVQAARDRDEQRLATFTRASQALEAVSEGIEAPAARPQAQAGGPGRAPGPEQPPAAGPPPTAKRPSDPDQVAELIRRGEPLQQVGIARGPDPEPVARVETLKGSPTIVMSIPATRDRVTMIDLATQRRATLRLGRPMRTIRAVVSQSGLGPMSSSDRETSTQRRERQMVDGLIGLEIIGERVETAAVFDRAAMQWFEHPLPHPAAHVRPDMTPFSTLIGFGIRSLEPTAELLVFDARDRGWPIVPLPTPAAGFIPADVSIYGTVTFEAGRTLAVYSQAARRSGAVELARPLPPEWPEEGNGVRRVHEKFLDFQDRKLVIPDGDLIRIFDPRSATWTAITTDGDK